MEKENKVTDARLSRVSGHTPGPTLHTFGGGPTYAIQPPVAKKSTKAGKVFTTKRKSPVVRMNQSFLNPDSIPFSPMTNTNLRPGYGTNPAVNAATAAAQPANTLPRQPCQARTPMPTQTTQNHHQHIPAPSKDHDEFPTTTRHNERTNGEFSKDFSNSDLTMGAEINPSCLGHLNPDFSPVFIPGASQHHGLAGGKTPSPFSEPRVPTQSAPPPPPPQSLSRGPTTSLLDHNNRAEESLIKQYGHTNFEGFRSYSWMAPHSRGHYTYGSRGRGQGRSNPSKLQQHQQPWLQHGHEAMQGTLA